MLLSVVNVADNWEMGCKLFLGKQEKSAELRSSDKQDTRGANAGSPEQIRWRRIRRR
jgi:hypothetical protein